MDTVIIFKQDGSIQCQDDAPRSLEDDANSLLSIGASRICGQLNVPGPIVVPAACGFPTSQVNAFAIPVEDWELISRGIVGTLGFRLWSGADFPPIELEAGCEITGCASDGCRNVSSTPVLIRDLIGLRVRVYTEGDPLTQDYLPDRVNIERAHSGLRIADVWFG